jgi:hypothetical protein
MNNNDQQNYPKFVIGSTLTNGFYIGEQFGSP